MAMSAVSFGADAVEESSQIISNNTDEDVLVTPELEMNIVPIQVSSYNEIEMVLQMREATPQELQDMHISQEEANEIAEIDIEQAYYERAQLPEAQLRAYGYTDEQIVILKAYDGSTITSNSPVVAAAATCTGTVSAVSASTSKIVFRYNWSWSSAPLFMYTDKMAIAWKAFNSSSSEIDVNNTQSTSVRYLWTSTGGYCTTEFLSPSTSIDTFTGCSANITMQYPRERNGNADFIWAKSGSTTVTLTKVNSNISYIKLSGSYGHTSIQIGISVSFGEGSLPSISFAPSTKVTKYATVTKKLTSSGTLTSI